MKRTIKVFYSAFRRLSWQKIVKLFSVWLPHPLLSLLSFYATVKSFSIAKKYFPKTNGTNGIGNAFRHALWTSLIMMYCCKVSSPQKAIAFCKKITDLHEELFPNESLETEMDLHNNTVGMNLFMEMLPGIHRQFFETSFLVDRLLDKTKNAKILKPGNEDYGNHLVYLEA